MENSHRPTIRTASPASSYERVAKFCTDNRLEVPGDGMDGSQLASALIAIVAVLIEKAEPMSKKSRKPKGGKSGC